MAAWKTPALTSIGLLCLSLFQAAHSLGSDFPGHYYDHALVALDVHAGDVRFSLTSNLGIVRAQPTCNASSHATSTAESTLPAAPIHWEVPAVTTESSNSANGSNEVLKQRAAIRAEFAWSWAAYEAHAWGRDELLPISQTGRDWVPGGIGLTLLDSLDSLIIMGLNEASSPTAPSYTAPPCSTLFQPAQLSLIPPCRAPTQPTLPRPTLCCSTMPHQTKPDPTRPNPTQPSSPNPILSTPSTPLTRSTPSTLLPSPSLHHPPSPPSPGVRARA